MAVNITFDGLDGVISSLEEKAGEIIARAERGIALGGKEVEGEAKALCPVDTGELRQSITSQPDGLTCDIGTNKEYAMYVEFGTYKMAPQPYLVPSLKNKEDDVIDIIKDAING